MFGVVLIIFVLTLLYYLIATKPYNYWSKKGVPTGKIVPIFGENLRICLGKESPAEMIQRMYNKLEGVRYIGAYQFHVPVLILKCPELIKQMCVKDSDHTLDHGDLILASGDELWSNSLVSLKGQHWKDMRAIVSPAFTGSKLKLMFSSVCDHAKAFTQHFLDKNDDYVEGEFRDAYTRYCSDCIAHNAFGVQVDSMKDRTNRFYSMAFDSCDFTIPWKKFVLFLYQLFPKVSRILGMSVFGKDVKFYFLNLVRDTIKVRQEQKIKRPDLVGLLMEAREEQTRESLEKKASQEETSSVRALKQRLTDDNIASQAFVIFVGAFETGSITMCFMAYELATNPECQKKLMEEIDGCCAENEEVKYETIMNLPYLDTVVSETMRKWPGSVGISRVVTKPYTIQPKLPEEKPVHLEKGVNITIPIFGIHRDPKYFENPDKFDPERFSPENKDKIDPNTYLPFGIGPRYCIGSRYGLLTVKSVFFFLLQNFEIVPTEKTQIPLVISKDSMNLTSENGFPLGMRRRKKL